jgi:hypothetical protein
MLVGLRRSLAGVLIRKSARKENRRDATMPAFWKGLANEGKEQDCWFHHLRPGSRPNLVWHMSRKLKPLRNRGPRRMGTKFYGKLTTATCCVRNEVDWAGKRSRSSVVTRPTRSHSPSAAFPGRTEREERSHGEQCHDSPSPCSARIEFPKVDEGRRSGKPKTGRNRTRVIRS